MSFGGFSSYFKRFCRAGDVFAVAGLAITLMAPQAVTAQTNISSAPLVVGNDRGGDLRERIYEIRALRQTGQPVQIQGRICYSTCTMYLGLPQTCVSPTTTFGFHGPSSYGLPLAPAVFDRASELIRDHYPQQLQKWYMESARHQIWSLHRISGTEIIRMGVAAC